MTERARGPSRPPGVPTSTSRGLSSTLGAPGPVPAERPSPSVSRPAAPHPRRLLLPDGGHDPAEHGRHQRLPCVPVTAACPGPNKRTASPRGCACLSGARGDARLGVHGGGPARPEAACTGDTGCWEQEGDGAHGQDLGTRAWRKRGDGPGRTRGRGAAARSGLRKRGSLERGRSRTLGKSSTTGRSPRLGGPRPPV